MKTALLLLLLLLLSSASALTKHLPSMERRSASWNTARHSPTLLLLLLLLPLSFMFLFP